MAIKKKLIHFQTLANFEAQLSAGNILDTSICFIKDAKKIWTHGEFYDCSEGVSEANVQAVDTSETLEDVTADYATRAYVDGLVGDINSVLESIINGDASIITFYINQTFIETTIECQAEDGMTWEEWCNSSYNTFGYYIEGTSIVNDDGIIIVLDGIYVSNTDIIQSGVTYNWG